MATSGRFRAYAAVVLFLTIVSTAPAKYSGGTGEPNDPYQIATAEDLIALGKTPEDYDKHFVLTADIDLDPNLPGRKIFDKAIIAPAKGAPGLGVQGTGFCGVFDGAGHVISHLTINGESCLGLFGRVEFEAVVRNVRVLDVNITGTGSYVGGLIGCNDGSVTDCRSTGAVSGTSRVGGLVGGQDWGTATGCCSDGCVRGNDDVGGLIGWSIAGWISCCYSTSSVSGRDRVGGLVGANYADETLGTVFYGHIGQCYSAGNVVGENNVGGLAGYYEPEPPWCYYIGVCPPGAIGIEDDNREVDCFWDVQTSGQATSAGGTGKTTAEMKTTRTFLRWGTCGDGGTWTIDEGNDYPRLAWEDRPGIVLDFLLSDFLEGSGTEEDPYLIYTQDDIDTIAWFPCESDQSFRLMFVSGKGSQDDPYLIETAEQIGLFNLCPYERRAQYKLRFVEGEGTQEDPYLIYTAQELNLVGLCSGGRDAHFKLMADIDLSDFDGKEGRPTFNIIAPDRVSATFVGTPFTGVFNGNGHIISHLTVSGGGHLGLFGQLSGMVEDLGVVGVNITGTGSYVGGLAGRNGGTVIRCYSTGVVSGRADIGGLVGINYGQISSCCSTALVSGNDYIGGLVGDNRGAVTQCSSTGTVDGNDYVGGLLGYDWRSHVTQCYSLGIVRGNDCVGGLAGKVDGTWIDNCRSGASVSGRNAVGGLVGMSSPAREDRRRIDFVGGGSFYYTYSIYHPYSISQCYSAGTVVGDEKVGGIVGHSESQTESSGKRVEGELLQCFWDIQTSGTFDGVGNTDPDPNEVIGKSTAEMQTASTFLQAGWDFVGETANGSEDIWWIDEGKDYPRLWWETGDEQSP